MSLSVTAAILKQVALGGVLSRDTLGIWLGNSSLGGTVPWQSRAFIILGLCPLNANIEARL